MLQLRAYFRANYLTLCAAEEDFKGVFDQLAGRAPQDGKDALLWLRIVDDELRRFQHKSQTASEEEELEHLFKYLSAKKRDCEIPAAQVVTDLKSTRDLWYDHICLCPLLRL